DINLDLPDAAPGALAALGVKQPDQPPVPPEKATLPNTELPPAALEAFEAIVGGDHVRTDHEARVGHTRGWSTPDLLKLPRGDASDAPDAVVYPGSHDEVVALLKACSELRIAVVPFAGGTSVVGGLAADRGSFAGLITIDVGRLDEIGEIDGV